jgi:general secretion pathway protein H
MTDRDGANRDTTSRASAEAGFTLLEILVVFVVLGLVLGITVGRGKVQPASLEIQAATRQVAQTVSLARSRAIAMNRPVRFIVDSAARTIQVEGGPIVALPRGLSIAVSAISQEVATNGRATIRFYGDGSASGGRIGLADGQRRSQVGIDWLSGRVRVEQGI